MDMCPSLERLAKKLNPLAVCGLEFQKAVMPGVTIPIGPFIHFAVVLQTVDPIQRDVRVEGVVVRE